MEVRNGIELVQAEQLSAPFPIHFHDCYVIEVVLSGKDHTMIGGKSMVVDPGDVLVIPPYLAHSGGIVAGIAVNYLSLYPTIQQMESVCDMAGVPAPSFATPILRDHRLSQILIEAHESAWYDRDSRSLSLGLAELVDRHGRAATGQFAAQDMSSASQFLRDHFHEHHSIESLAQRFGYSPFHFIRRFARHTGMSPFKFLKAARVDWARKHLRTTPESIGDIAIRAGFSDHAHFCRIFRSVLGFTPSQYRSFSNPVQA